MKYKSNQNKTNKMIYVMGKVGQRNVGTIGNISNPIRGKDYINKLMHLFVFFIYVN